MLGFDTIGASALAEDSSTATIDLICSTGTQSNLSASVVVTQDGVLIVPDSSQTNTTSAVSITINNIITIASASASQQNNDSGAVITLGTIVSLSRENIKFVYNNRTLQLSVSSPTYQLMRTP